VLNCFHVVMAVPAIRVLCWAYSMQMFVHRESVLLLTGEKNLGHFILLILQNPEGLVLFVHGWLVGC
jgi:hypothetical protein